MAQTSLIIGDTNWAVKEDSLLGYNVIQNKYLPIPIDCVRATTATRVNEQGLIEIVPRNLVTYSNDLDINWVKTNSTIETNSIISPNGTQTASKLTVLVATYAGLYQTGNSQSNKYTMSLYAKKGNKDWLYFVNLSGSSVIAWFNISNGTLGTITNGTASITDVGNGWYRCVYSNTNNITNDYFQIGLSDANNSVTPSSSGFSYIWGAQLENGSVATEYFPTTNRLDIPRIDYSTGTASLLVEPQRTNLLTYSNDFSNVSWVKQELTLTANSIISPDGTLNAYKLTPTTVNSPHQLNKLLISASVSNTMSFYAKKGGYDLVECLDGAIGFNGCKFNLNTGTFTNQGTGVGSMISVGNGWYRCIVTVVTTGIRFYVNNSSSYIGDGTSGIYLWGTQFETASYATSYIPTIASTVTRNADVLSRTGISGLIGQTEGTLFLDITFKNIDQLATTIDTLLTLNNGTTANEISILLDRPSGANKTILGYIRNASTNEVILYAPTTITATRYKIALSYKLNDVVLYINGTQIGTDTSAAIPTTSAVSLNSRSDNSFLNTQQEYIDSVQLYKTRLTNTELTQLTTL